MNYKKRAVKIKKRKLNMMLTAVMLMICMAYPQYVYAQVELEQIQQYDGSSAYTVLNDNIPDFTEDDMSTDAFENYSELDSLGRCQVAYANICQELMPTEKRGEIGMVKPSGWHTVKYPEVIKDNYLYNRCHLIAYCLAGENANEKNLITGTRYMNVSGMLPFETMVADFVKETGYHVLYRVTPIFEDDNLVASGVEMEAKSVEDNGEGILFHVYCYNVQPGVSIDYATGNSWLNEQEPDETEDDGIIWITEDAVDQDVQSIDGNTVSITYVLNTNTMKFHYPECSSVSKISDKNKQTYEGSRNDLISQGYTPCGNCNP